jgi:hypothetical protein
MTEKNPNWGGKRPGAGAKRRYLKVSLQGHAERSEREQLTPESDLSICIAEMDGEDGRRGVMIGDIWYGAVEALAIARYLNRRKYKIWLAE